MNPGVSAVTTEVFPSRSINRTRASTVASLLCAPRATSTSGMRGAGLKKCRPATRPGVPTAEAIAVTERGLGFVASKAGGGQGGGAAGPARALGGPIEERDGQARREGGQGDARSHRPGAHYPQARFTIAARWHPLSSVRTLTSRPYCFASWGWV